MIPTEGVPAWVPGGLFMAWAVRELWGSLKERRKVSVETDANIELLNQLRAGLDRQGQQILQVQEANAQISLRLDEEIKQRQAAQEEAHRLRMRVQMLESVMRQVGAVIPPEHKG